MFKGIQYKVFLIYKESFLITCFTCAYICLKTLKKIEAEVKEEIRDSVKKALQSPESPKTNLEEDSYA